VKRSNTRPVWHEAVESGGRRTLMVIGAIARVEESLMSMRLTIDVAVGTDE